jgi:hypothetical protein
MRLARFFTLIVCVSVLAAFYACREEGEDKPANLIPDEKFVDLLVDFSLSESASNSNVKQIPNLKSDSVYAFNPLLENNIRKSQYDSTLSYYASHISEYKAIYETVLERISAMQAQATGTKNAKAQE